METWKGNCVNFTFFITFRMMFQQGEWGKSLGAELEAKCATVWGLIMKQSLRVRTGWWTIRLWKLRMKKFRIIVCRVEMNSRVCLPTKFRSATENCFSRAEMNFHFISAFIFGLPSTVFYVHIFRKYEFFMGLRLRRRAMYLWRAVRFVVFTTKVLLNWVLLLFARDYHNLDFRSSVFTN